ncbi:MAG: phosphoribosylanthranilate isomerase [Alphaproteobacteria bacterium]|nr:phosphoribosylanthranilate isomerase [Alphaproteobacteria bacterium]
MAIAVKICGITDRPALEAAVGHGARFVGFVFYPPSPRSLPHEAAATLARAVPERVARVGVFVDPKDDELKAVTSAVPLEAIQLHGSESAARIEAIRALTGKRIIKAIRVARAEDVAEAVPFARAADWLLYDAKVSTGQGLGLPGGNAIAFDWGLLRGRAVGGREGWILSGGLNPDNVRDAIAATEARALDVSSGVEDSPGRKNPAAIRAFLEAAHAT